MHLLPALSLNGQMPSKHYMSVSSMRSNYFLPWVFLLTFDRLLRCSLTVNCMRKDIVQAVELALPHRARAGTPLRQQLTQTLDRLPEGTTDVDIPQEIATIDDDIDVDKRNDEREGAAGLTRRLRGEQDVVQVQALISVERDRLTRQESGRRFLSLSARLSGRFTRSRQSKPVTDIAFAATIRAAAPYQRVRGRNNGGKLKLHPEDLRQKIRERKTRSLLVFVIDGSDSVMARQLMPKTKRILLALLQNAYEKRDRVAMLVFRF